MNIKDWIFLRSKHATLLRNFITRETVFKKVDVFGYKRDVQNFYSVITLKIINGSNNPYAF